MYPGGQPCRYVMPRRTRRSVYVHMSPRHGWRDHRLSAMARGVQCVMCYSVLEQATRATPLQYASCRAQARRQAAGLHMASVRPVAPAGSLRSSQQGFCPRPRIGIGSACRPRRCADCICSSNHTAHLLSHSHTPFRRC